ncbi:MAG: aldo/keto reductase [Gaiellaceae bacterium]
MEQRLLGRTGLKVSALAFGTMTFGGKGRFSAVGSTQIADAREQIARCVDAGINLIDTADVYSLGASEEVLGQAIAGRREELLIATKCNTKMSADPNAGGSSRHHVHRACEASLRRLRTDYIDLYQVHSVDELTAIEETLEALDDLVRSGKVRYIGCSNYASWQLMRALATSESRKLSRFASLQAYYSLIARELEWDLLPLCEAEQLGVLVWSPLAGGFLSGKHDRGTESAEGTRRATIATPGLADEEQGFAIVDVLREIAAERNVSAAQVALNYIAYRPGVTSVIIGARDEAQLEDNLAAVGWQLDPEQVRRLDEVSARPLPYPHWHQHLYNSERMLPRAYGPPWPSPED